MEACEINIVSNVIFSSLCLIIGKLPYHLKDTSLHVKSQKIGQCSLYHR